MARPQVNGKPAVLAWCDERTIELLQTSLHPAPRLFPALEDEIADAELTGGRSRIPSSSCLRGVIDALTVVGGGFAKGLASRFTSLWAEAAR